MTPSPMYPSPGAVPPKKTPVWVWILVGFAGFLVLMMGLVVAGGFFLANKALQVLDDPKQLAEVVHQINPDLDVIDVDKERKVIRVRDKQKDETYTVALDQLKSGRLKLEKEGKDGVESVQFGGKVDLPNWVPVYPDSQPRVIGQAHSDAKGDGGLLQFSTPDDSDKVRAFYKEALEKRGFTRDAQHQEDHSDHWVSEDDALHLVVNARTFASRTKVDLLFGEKKKK